MKLFVFAFLALGAISSGRAATQPGLVLTFAASGDATTEGPQMRDSLISSNIALYVSEGNSGSPFLPAGKFSATWTGFLLADLRTDYTFSAELQGDLRISLNGLTAFETKTGSTNLSRPVRLNKGTNAFIAEYRSPGRGDAFLRFFWTPPDLRPEPIPLAAMVVSGSTNPELLEAEKRRMGRHLFLEHRCSKCHRISPSLSPLPELTIDAPSFENIGSRLKPEWMASWILHPKGQRADARMPRLLFGAEATAKARFVSAYLSSLKLKTIAPAKEIAPDSVEKGKSLFDTLHCGGCHSSDSPSAFPGMTLNHLKRKFLPGALEEYLLQPELHYAWTRMPNFKLDPTEVTHLAAYLLSVSDKSVEGASPGGQEIETGKSIVQSQGCLNCHTLSQTPPSPAILAIPLLDLPSGKWERGCLASNRAPDSRAPDFEWTAAQREALQLFAGTDRKSLTRHVPAEFAVRQMHNLNCAGCHGKFDGFPALGVLGGKLNPAWSADFISGSVQEKPRPWLEARMPAFTRHGRWLGPGLAIEHGYPQQIPPARPIDPALVQVGQKLAGPDGGFSCISCHGVGSLAPIAVFESPGINLVYSGDRLLKPYFDRWLHNPPRIDPETKMPVYFIEGKSSLTDIFEGDADQQINAIWEYIRLGRKMPLPTGVSPP